MNTTQAKYFSERVKEIAQGKYEKLKSDLEKLNPNEITWAQKYKLIAAGKATLKSLEDINSYTDIAKAFIYQADAPKQKAYEAAKKDYDKKVSNIYAKRTQIIDQAMLGDSELAAKLLADFETYTG